MSLQPLLDYLIHLFSWSMPAGPIGHAEESSAQRGPEDDTPKTTNAPASPWKSLKIVLSLLLTS